MLINYNNLPFELEKFLKFCLLHTNLCKTLFYYKTLFNMLIVDTLLFFFVVFINTISVKNIMEHER